MDWSDIISNTMVFLAIVFSSIALGICIAEIIFHKDRWM